MTQQHQQKDELSSFEFIRSRHCPVAAENTAIALTTNLTVNQLPGIRANFFEEPYSKLEGHKVEQFSKQKIPRMCALIAS